MTFERWIQTRLVAHGASLSVDGDIGRLTISALKNFQGKRGLRQTGVADSATVEELREPAKAVGIIPAEEVVDEEPTATVPPWMYELVRRMGQHESQDKAELIEFLKIGAFLGDPAKLPWCGDAVESAIVKTLPNETVPSNPFFAQNWKNFGRAVDYMVGALGIIRWSPTAGHIGTISKVTASSISMVGGNQTNSITNSTFPRSKFIACRWPLTFPITEYPPFNAATVQGGGIVSTR